MTIGKKFDNGKAPLVTGCFAYFPLALQQVARVSDYGRQKYTTTLAERNWYYLPDGVSRYTDGLGRHVVNEAVDGLCDPESGLLHAAHAAWNALARLELMLGVEGIHPGEMKDPHAARPLPAPTDDDVPF